MTTIQRIVQLFGWIFIVIAIWGAIVTGTSMDADPATAPRLWGLFPVNFLHNLVHLLLGMWGVVAARSHGGSRSYGLLAGALYIVLAVLGLLSPHGFGLVPLGGNDIWLHLVLGAILLVAGLVATSRSASTKLEPAPIRTVMPPGGARRPDSDSAAHDDPAADDDPAGTPRAPMNPASPAGPASPGDPAGPTDPAPPADAAPPTDPDPSARRPPADTDPAS